MHKKVIVVLSLTVALVLTSAWMVAGEETEGELCVPVGTLELAAPEGVEAKKGAVAFPHGVHFDYSCQTCHHKWEKTAELQSCMASGCHDVTVAPKKAAKAEAVKYYKTAFHTLCIDCHKTIKTKNQALELSGKLIDGELPATGPTGCVECHPKLEE